MSKSQVLRQSRRIQNSVTSATLVAIGALLLVTKFAIRINIKLIANIVTTSKALVPRSDALVTSSFFLLLIQRRNVSTCTVHGVDHVEEIHKDREADVPCGFQEPGACQVLDSLNMLKRNSHVEMY